MLIVVLVLVMMVALAGFGFLAAMSTEYEARATEWQHAAGATNDGIRGIDTELVCGLSKRERRAAWAAGITIRRCFEAGLSSL